MARKKFLCYHGVRYFRPARWRNGLQVHSLWGDDANVAVYECGVFCGLTANWVVVYAHFTQIK